MGNMVAEKEIRSSLGSNTLFEKREDGGSTITGIAAPFYSDSVDFGMWVERYDAKAFDRTLREKPDVRALVDHDTGLIVGRTTAGNLKLEVKEGGLAYEFQPPQTTLGRDLAYNVEARILTNVSIGFMVIEEKWTKLDGGRYLRTLLDVNLWEMSFVAFPAYPETTAEARSAIFERGKALADLPPIELQRERESRWRKLQIIKAR